MSEWKYLLYDKMDRMVKITLNCPESLNAFSTEMYQEVKWAFVEAESDPDIEIVILTGAGRAFTAGGNLKEVSINYADRSEMYQGAQRFMEGGGMLFRQLDVMTKIIIAMVNGIAFAGGMVLTTRSDIVIASEQARFKVPEGLVGIYDPYIPTRLPQIVGLARAKALILMAEEFDAYEAQKMGLVWKVVPHEELWTETLKIAYKVLQLGPRARAMYKRILYDSLPQSDLRQVIECQTGWEAGEGTTAFAQGRKPSWAQHTPEWAKGVDAMRK